MLLNRNFVALAAAFFACLIVLPGVSLADDAARGRALYDLCAQCHGTDGGGMKLSLAPAIAGLEQWYIESQLKMFRSGARGLHPDDVAGMRMSPMSRWLRSDDDITAVSSYVASFPPVAVTPESHGGNVEAGKTFYQTCQACHGPEAQGNQAMNAPALRNNSPWYLISALEKYKAGVRGSNPANTNAVLMRGMANILPNDQAIKDVVAYIETLSTTTDR
jgi:cytochrome c553